MLIKHLRDSMEWALMVALVLGAGAIAEAQQEETQPEGRLVQIGPSDNQDAAAKTNAATTGAVPEQFQQAADSNYWIGLLGGPVTPELRAHLDIPEDQGIMIRDIVPESPAAKAGLEKYDVLLAANDTPLHGMSDLVALVRNAGESQGQITLEVLRRGQIETVAVTPTERPAQYGYGVGPGAVNGWGQPGMAMPEEMLRHFAQQLGHPDGGARQFRSFGPGVVAGGQSSALADFPNGVSVSIQRENDQPPHITVKRGNDTWTIDGDDPESLKQLPDDVRPFVEHLLHGSMPLGVNGLPLPEAVPMMPRVGQSPAMQGQELSERIEAMEQHVQELQKQLEMQMQDPASSEAR